MTEKIKKSVVSFLIKARFVVLIVVLAGISLEIFLPGEPPDILIFGLVIAWLIVMFVWKLEANFSFAISLFFLIASQIFLMFVKSGPLKNDSPAEKAALWFYIFIFIGIVKRLIEMKKDTEGLVKLFDVFKLLITPEEREETIDLVKKWSVEKQKLALTKKNSFKISLDLIFNLTQKLALAKKNSLKVSFSLMFNLIKIKTKFLLIKIIALIKTNLQFVKKQLIYFAIVFFSWVIREVKRFFREFFDFSASPTLNLVKEAVRRLVMIENSNKTVINLIKFSVIEVLILYFIVIKLIKEVKFYRLFFEDLYFHQLVTKLLPNLAFFWLMVICLTIFYMLLRPKLNGIILTRLNIKNNNKRFFVNILLFCFGLSFLSAEKLNVSISEAESFRPAKNKWFFLVISLLVLYFGSRHIFWKIRDRFEFFPYITRINYDIASRYSYVIIFGHNFRNMPFRGKVSINDREQKIIEWSDEKIIIETDPIMSNSGDLIIANDYGFGKGIESNIFKFTYFDSRGSSSDDEKRFWTTLKEKALKSSFEYLNK